MRIISNLLALNALGNTNKNEKKVAASLEHLSSGLRIDKAGDDAAGLAISEKMRGQIRGFIQAGRNVQDGISLVQVADAGLGEITDQLQRARELTIQAATGTLTSSDRENIQKEIDHIVAGIDGVANNTEFNTIKLLAPPKAELSPSNIKQNKVDLVLVVDNTGSMSGLQTAMADNLNDLVAKLDANDVRIGLVSYDDSNGIRRFDFSSSNWTTGLPTNAWSQNPAPVSSALKSLVNAGGSEYTMQAIGTVAAEYAFRDNVSGMQTKHIILLTNEDADDQSGDAADPAVLAALGNKGIRVHTVYSVGADSFGDSTADIADLATSTGGSSVDIRDAGWGSKLSSIIGNAINQVAEPERLIDEMPTLFLQVGANTRQAFGVELFDARPEQIGVKPLVVNPQNKAVEAIGKIEGAITIVLTQRGKFGAYQNALEHIGSNIDNAIENLTAAESHIRDVDMAKEMITFQKNSILAQTAQAMLVQANQQPQSVLSLLK